MEDLKLTMKDRYQALKLERHDEIAYRILQPDGTYTRLRKAAFRAWIGDFVVSVYNEVLRQHEFYHNAEISIEANIRKAISIPHTYVKNFKVDERTFAKTEEQKKLLADIQSAMLDYTPDGGTDDED